MWTMIVALASAGTGHDAQVAKGWYLWQTGQSQEAYAVADALPEGLTGAAVPFVVAMAVDRGDGTSLEVELRDVWSEAPNDMSRRIALAWVISLRRSEKGSWCDEVEGLLKPVAEGEDRFWAAQAGRQQELRCAGSTEHAEAELRRIAKEGAGATGEAVVGMLRAGYYKEGATEKVEETWTAEPHLLRYAGYPFLKTAGGPALPGVKRVTNNALKTAVESGDAMIVHAAMLGYRGAERDKQAEEAQAQLLVLDPKADPSLTRTMDVVADPPEVGALDVCARTAMSFKSGLACVDAVKTGEAGAVAAYRQNTRRMLLEQLNDADGAFSAAKAAYVADPENRLYARMFMERARARGEELPLAVQAALAVMRDRIPANAEDVLPSLRARRAAGLEQLAWTEVAAGLGADALGHMTMAMRLEDTPARRHGLGQTLAAAGRDDDAVMVLLYAVAEPLDDTVMMTRSRSTLEASLGKWHAGGLSGALDEVRRPLGKAVEHPLVGKPLPEGVLPASDGEPPAATVVVLWADWRPAAVSALERLDGIAKRYAERNVRLVALDVGLDVGVVPEELALTNLRGSSSTMRALGLVALPSAVVVDGKGVVQAVLAGYDSGGLGLEEALDETVPEEAAAP